MSDEIKLSPAQLDALREIGNIDGRLIIMLNLEEIIGLPKEGK